MLNRSKMIHLVLLTVFFLSINTYELTPIVNLPDGPIQGKVSIYEGVDVYHFLGVPYAQPPLGKLRLQSPVVPNPWTEVKPVTKFGSACPQVVPPVPDDVVGPEPVVSDEDCLYLNVYTTESTFNARETHLRPVLFWIHGGGFLIGSGDKGTDGIPMVPLHDVVLVTINYRLNAFGFMYFGDDEPRIPANLGLRDQLMALKWVHANIANFGGDPNKVTIFGESAGAMSVSSHILSPLSKGLFKRAIIESGTIYTGNTDPNILIKNSWSLYNKTSCSGSKNVLDCLQNMSASEFLSNLPADLTAFSPIVGDDFLPYEPEHALTKGLFDNSIDVLLGVEGNEASLFMTLLNATYFNPVQPLHLTYQDAVYFLSLLFDEQALDYFSEIYFGDVDIQDSDCLRSQFEKAYSDLMFVCPTYIFGLQYISSLKDAKGGKVFAYYHTQSANEAGYPDWMGTVHASDVTYVFGLPLVIPGYSEKDILLSREMMKIWTNFAETGEMPLIGDTEWKPLQDDLSAIILNTDFWGQIERERVEFCKKHWFVILRHRLSH